MSEKTSTGKIVSAVGGLLLIVSLFLKWAGIDVPDVAGAITGATEGLPGSVQDSIDSAQKTAEAAASMNAFDIFGWLPFLYIVLGLLAIAPLALDLLDMEIELPFDSSLISLVGGLLVLGGMLQVLDSPGGVKIGAWIALLSAIAITAGGFLQVTEGDAAPGASGPVAYAPPAPAAAPPPAAPPAAAPPAAAPPAAAPPPPGVPPQAPPPGPPPQAPPGA